VAAIDRAIEAVRRQDSQAAGVLSRLAKSFDYQRMRGLL